MTKERGPRTTTSHVGNTLKDETVRGGGSLSYRIPLSLTLSGPRRHGTRGTPPPGRDVRYRRAGGCGAGRAPMRVVRWLTGTRELSAARRYALAAARRPLPAARCGAARAPRSRRARLVAAAPPCRDDFTHTHTHLMHTPL